MKPITYSLNDLRGNADFFYWQLKRVTDIVLWKAERLIGPEVNQHIHFLGYLNLEEPRTKKEYFMELMLLSVLWKEYASQAIQAKAWKLKLLSGLYSIRQASKLLRPATDRLRGLLISPWLGSKAADVEVEPTLTNLNKLLVWLEASGDYSQESKRLRNWQKTLLVMPYNYADSTLRRVVAFSPCLSDLCVSTLGEFTWRVDNFLSSYQSNYRGRADYVFCGKSEAEYHINMLGTEITNRIQHEDFQNKPRKAALLPTCMRTSNVSDCNAIDDKGVSICVGCNSECNIGKSQRELAKHDVRTYLIPDSSDLSRVIKRWENDPSIALIGAACVPKLLRSEYEMKTFNIPSQHVPLNHCGCQKHWHDKGVPTSLSLDHLKQLVEPPQKQEQSEYVKVKEMIEPVAG